MQIFLRSLAQGVMFQIIGFGTNTDPLFKKKEKTRFGAPRDVSAIVEYNDETLEAATKYVKDMKANLGG